MQAAAVMPASGTAPFKPEVRRFKRSLPSGAKTTHVEGIGIIAVQSVGSTAYTTGYHCYLHRTGAEESVSGMTSFSLQVMDDGSLDWIKRPDRSWDQGKFSHAEIMAMLEVVRARRHLDEVDYLFHVHGCIEPLIIAHEREIKQQKNTIEHMNELLKDETEPKSIFVPKAQDPAGKGFSRPRDPSNPADVAEYNERRLWWRMNRQRAEDKLEALTSGEKLLRYDLLKRYRWAHRRWSGADQEWVFPKSKRRKPERVKPKLFDLLERARTNTIDVTDY